MFSINHYTRHTDTCINISNKQQQGSPVKTIILKGIYIKHVLMTPITERLLDITHTHSCMHTHTHSTHTHTHTHSLTHSLRHARTHSQHTHTHAHTRPSPHSSLAPPFLQHLCQVQCGCLHGDTLCYTSGH